VKPSSRRVAWAGILVTVLCAAGCASAVSDLPNGDAFDASSAAGPDADPAAPDAMPGAIDGGVVIVADAAVAGTPDAAVAAACTLVQQTGCTAGMACDLGAANAPMCRAVTAQGTATSSCSDPTACSAGYTCIGSGAATRSCMRYCSADSDCGGAAGALCIISITDGNMVPIPGATLCTQSCNPVSSAGCPANWGCHVYTESAGAMRTLSSCDPPGAGGQNAACTENSGCQAGFSCFSVTQGTTTTTKCLKNCNATAGTGCAGVTGTTCQGNGMAVLGGVSYGACL
jgi:hypothetical protein